MKPTRVAAAAAGALAVATLPAVGATGDYPWVSLRNSDFVVLIAFVLFGGILVYFKVPAMLTGMLDQRAETIRKELDDARALREEAQTLLAEFERKQKDVQEEAQRIVAQARSDAEAGAVEAKKELERTIGRRLKAAEDQIASAEEAAVREVRNSAAQVAVAAAADVIRSQLGPEDSARLIDESLSVVDARLH
ncbi:MAG: F0F1 ATP synthase subunit B [Paracoccaceae bacterium]|jgi:F-type H+-transporting ATPase subunit b|nr:F0F1 ATP synthase subunit B [Paracoccaceae bacterium]